MLIQASELNEAVTYIRLAMAKENTSTKCYKKDPDLLVHYSKFPKHLSYYSFSLHLYSTTNEAKQSLVDQMNKKKARKSVQEFLPKVVKAVFDAMGSQHLYEWRSKDREFSVYDTDTIYSNVELPEPDSDYDEDRVPPEFWTDHKRRAFEMISFCNVTSQELEDAILSPPLFETLKQRVKRMYCLVDSLHKRLRDNQFDDEDSEYCTDEDERYDCATHRTDHIHIENLTIANGAKVSLIGGSHGILLMELDHPLQKQEERHNEQQQQEQQESSQQEQKRSQKETKQKKRKRQDSIIPAHKRRRIFKERLYSPDQFKDLLQYMFTNEVGICWHKMVDVMYKLWTSAEWGHEYSSTSEQITYELDTRERNKNLQDIFKEACSHYSLFTLDAFRDVFILDDDPENNDTTNLVCVLHQQPFFMKRRYKLQIQ
jgi:hypothetical protein